MEWTSAFRGMRAWGLGRVSHSNRGGVTHWGFLLDWIAKTLGPVNLLGSIPKDNVSV